MRNLVRLMIVNTAAMTGASPQGLSFTSAFVIVESGWTSVFRMEEEMLCEFASDPLRELSKHRATHRSGRIGMQRRR